MQYSIFKTESDMRLFERYYISKHKPKYNTQYIASKGNIDMRMKEPKWKVFIVYKGIGIIHVIVLVGIVIRILMLLSLLKN